MRKLKMVISVAAVGAVGVVAGSAVGATILDDQPGDARPQTTAPSDVPDRFRVWDASGPVGYVSRADFERSPQMVDGEVFQPYAPNAGWDVLDDSGALVGYYVPRYGFMTPAQAEQFLRDPSSFTELGALPPDATPDTTPGAP